MKNSEIAKLFQKIKSFGLFTNSRTHEKVYDALKRDPDGEDGAKFIATTGVPKGERECSECRRIFPESEFSYYQTRVKSDGSLMRSNALCNQCERRLGREKNQVLSSEIEKIPPKPKKGAICPKCRRAWSGNWHRDHDYKTGKFRRWLCGQCNMAQHDRRTPDPE